MSSKTPDKVPDLLAYFRLLSKAEKALRSAVWLGCNKLFRENAAADKSLLESRRSIFMGNAYAVSFKLEAPLTLVLKIRGRFVSVLMKGGAVLVLAVNFGISARLLWLFTCLSSCFKTPKGSQGGRKRVRSPVSVALKPNKVFDQFVHHI